MLHLPVLPQLDERSQPWEGWGAVQVPESQSEPRERNLSGGEFLEALLSRKSGLVRQVSFHHVIDPPHLFLMTLTLFSRAAGGLCGKGLATLDQC